MLAQLCDALAERLDVLRDNLPAGQQGRHGRVAGVVARILVAFAVEAELAAGVLDAVECVAKVRRQSGLDGVGEAPGGAWRRGGGDGDAAEGAAVGRRRAWRRGCRGFGCGAGDGVANAGGAG